MSKRFEVRAWLLQRMPQELTALNLACLILSGPLVAASLLFLTWMTQVRPLMRQVYKAARDRGHSLRFLLLPEHKDVTEWFEAGRTLDDMLKEVR